MAMSLAEAAAATGVNRPTLFRAYKSGRMSATRADTGQIEVDPAELFRVFPWLRRSRAHRGICTSSHRLTVRTIMRCEPMR
jgi:predicted site-specific integrase-resolvase